MADIRLVRLSKRAQRNLEKVPRHVVVNLMAWVTSVEDEGLMVTRRIPGYHDEPLKGARAG